MEAIPSNTVLPFRAAAAYGISRAAPGISRPAPSQVAAAPIVATQADRVDASLAKIRPLVGATVPGRVDFSGATPVQTGVLPLYRHPFDRNAAATNIASGKAIDVTG
jgi:hypothetical protein